MAAFHIEKTRQEIEEEKRYYQTRSCATLPTFVHPKTESRRRRIWGFRGLVKMFRRKAGRKSIDASENSQDMFPTFRARSASELSVEPVHRSTSGSFTQGLSVSHDSVFCPESPSKPQCSTAGERGEGKTVEIAAHHLPQCIPTLPQNKSLSIPRAKFPLSVPEGRQRTKRKTFGTRLKLSDKKRNASDLNKKADGLRNKEDSLRKVDVARNSEHLFGKSSKTDLVPKSEKVAVVLDNEPAAGFVPLSHNAAMHKISVRPKRSHGPPRRYPKALLSCSTSSSPFTETSEFKPLSNVVNITDRESQPKPNRYSLPSQGLTFGESSHDDEVAKQPLWNRVSREKLKTASSDSSCSIYSERKNSRSSSVEGRLEGNEDFLETKFESVTSNPTLNNFPLRSKIGIGTDSKPTDRTSHSNYVDSESFANRIITSEEPLYINNSLESCESVSSYGNVSSTDTLTTTPFIGIYIRSNESSNATSGASILHAKEEISSDLSDRSGHLSLDSCVKIPEPIVTPNVQKTLSVDQLSEIDAAKDAELSKYTPVVRSISVHEKNSSGISVTKGRRCSMNNEVRNDVNLSEKNTSQDIPEFMRVQLMRVESKTSPLVVFETDSQTGITEKMPTKINENKPKELDKVMAKVVGKTISGTERIVAKIEEIESDQIPKDNKNEDELTESVKAEEEEPTMKKNSVIKIEKEESVIDNIKESFNVKAQECSIKDNVRGILQSSQSVTSDSASSPKESRSEKEEIVLRRPSVVDRSIVLDQVSGQNVSSAKQDQPELYKVFARRSFKLKDLEMEINECEDSKDSFTEQNELPNSPTESTKPMPTLRSISSKKQFAPSVTTTKFSEQKNSEEIKSKIVNKACAKNVDKKSDNIFQQPNTDDAGVGPRKSFVVGKLLHNENVKVQWPPQVLPNKPEPSDKNSKNVLGAMKILLPASHSQPIDPNFSSPKSAPIIEARNTSISHSFEEKTKDQVSSNEDWRALARQRREDRIKQTKLAETDSYSSDVREITTRAHTPKNSKVLEIANSFQKLQPA